MFDALHAPRGREHPALREFAFLIGVLALLTLWLDAVSTLVSALLPTVGSVGWTLAAGAAAYRDGNAHVRNARVR